MAATRTRSSSGISNPGKVFWPDEGYTKGDLAEFYEKIFPLLQPYVKDRILTLERCPDGLAGQCFYQKQAPRGLPKGTPTKRIATASANRTATDFVIGGKLETQLALVNLGCIPIHVCSSRAETYPKADWVCFDLDPASGEFAPAARAALLFKEVLDTLQLESFPKTSGGRGLHIFIPIKLGPSADDVLKFAEDVCGRLARAHPKDLTVEHSIARRGSRVYLDPFRNGRLQTVVAPYSVRRKPHAPFSMPLDWSEVKPSLDPSKFNLGNFRQKLRKKDPWADFFLSRQALAPALKKLARI